MGWKLKPQHKVAAFRTVLENIIWAAIEKEKAK